MSSIKIVLTTFLLPFLFSYNTLSSPNVSPNDFTKSVGASKVIRLEYQENQINSDYSCTASVKVYVPTQAGIIGFGLSVTADTCEEANAGLSDAVNGFIKEVF